MDVRYGFDVANRLISVTRTPGDSEVLDYGPDGELLRRRITSGGTTKDVFYFGEYGTVTATGCTTSCTAVANTVAVDAHLICAGTRIASARAASGNGATANRTLYYYRTRLGSVIGTSLRGGAAGAYYRYTPYGEVDRTNETDTTRSELGYTNALRLTGSLIHLVNRAYDAEAKVFVQSDVVDRLRYTYTGGDPINRSDPTGLEAIEDPTTTAGTGVHKTTVVYRTDGVTQTVTMVNGEVTSVEATFNEAPTSAAEQSNATSDDTGPAKENDTTQEKAKSQPEAPAYVSDDESLRPELDNAEKYLAGSEKGRQVLGGLRSLGGVKVRRPTAQDEKEHGRIWYDGKNNEIVWDPRAAVRFDKDTGRQSPAMGLLHEGVHHLLRYHPDHREQRNRERQMRDPDWNFPNLHERTVVRDWETPVARELGEQVRTNGRSPGWSTTTCVSCTVDRQF